MTVKKLPLIDKNMILPFWLLTSCFIVWGLAQDLTAPMVTAFKGIFTMSTFEASLVPPRFSTSGSATRWAS